jgi:Leucine-rich repeat (LRR) protein
MIMWRGLILLSLWKAINSRLVPDEYNALYTFYNSTHGETWTETCRSGWNFHGVVDPCIQKWRGLTCTPSTCTQTTDCYITALSLNLCSLTGTLPTEIGIFQKLNVMSLRENKIGGQIPSTIISLPLASIDFGSNKFTGPLPELPHSLYNLYLGSNSFTGPVPSYLTKISYLLTLDIRSNLFTGTFPKNLTSLPTLISLEFDSNHLTGTIPGPTGRQMQYYTGSQNHFHGPLPTHLCPSLTPTSSCSLTYFEFDQNQLTGTLSSTLFTQTSRLATLNLSSNLFTGTVPTLFNSLSRLKSLDLSSNHLTGEIGHILRSRSLTTIILNKNQFSGSMNFDHLVTTQLSRLQLSQNQLTGSLEFNPNYRLLSILDLSSNRFTSSLPQSFMNLTGLQQLTLHDNLFTSSLPIEFATRPFLRLVDLSFNYFTGTIPYQLFNSSTWYPSYSLLLNLYLHGNYFSGTIPLNICRAAAIRQVSLFNNFLTGTIPPLAQCATIQTILFQNNRFSGQPGTAFEVFNVPGTKYNNFTLLQAIDLSDNDFTGTIPKQIFTLPNILFVAIVGGCFKGDLPREICNATTLNTLVLEGLRSGEKCRNDFYDPWHVLSNRVYRTSTVGGTIPSCIWNLTHLQTLYLSGNLIEGSIPHTVSIPSSLVRLSLSYNKLTGTLSHTLLKHSYQYLDLEHNRLTGTSERLVIAPDMRNETHVTLSVNRLSGHIGNLDSLQHVDVLSGNLYSCQQSRHDLPKNDPKSMTYLCGSDALDLALLFWGLLTILFIVSVAISLYTIQYRRRFSSSFSDGEGFRRSTLNMLASLRTGTSSPSSPSSSLSISRGAHDPDLVCCENPLSRTNSNSTTLDESEGEGVGTNSLVTTPPRSSWQEQLSENIHLILEYSQEVSRINRQSNPELSRFLLTITLLRQFAIRLTLAAVTVFLGFYLTMKLLLDSGTHE